MRSSLLYLSEIKLSSSLEYFIYSNIAIYEEEGNDVGPRSIYLRSLGEPPFRAEMRQSFAEMPAAISVDKITAKIFLKRSQDTYPRLETVRGYLLNFYFARANFFHFLCILYSINIIYLVIILYVICINNNTYCL